MSQGIPYFYKKGKIEPANATQYADNGIQKCIENYISLINNELKQNQYKDEILLKDADFSFYLLFHGADDLDSTNFKYLFGQDLLRYGNKDKQPCIHITLYNVFEHIVDELTTQRYVKIIDSSIWNYYVPLDIKDGKDWKYSENVETFVQALKEIAYNKKRGLYDLAITDEYSDLNARLIEQSHLNGTHSDISPFLFHSEKEMRSKIDTLQYDETTSWKDEMRKYKWRFLLLDDKSVQNLRLKNREIGSVNKLRIIADNLYRIFGDTGAEIWARWGFNYDSLSGEWKPSFLEKIHFSGTTDLDKQTYGNPILIVIDCVGNVDDAKRCLQQKYKYEIVLLDYLLDKDKNDGKQEYGYQLLKALWNWNFEKKERERKNAHDEKLDTLYISGPNGRFYFMFISAFTTAVHERMLAEGFAKSERGLWYIGDGACPTNTPYLFSYRLMLLMRHRIKDLRQDTEGEQMTTTELLTEIYVKGKAEAQQIRQEAHHRFNHVLFMREKYKKLEKDFDHQEEKYLQTHNDDTNYIKSMKSSLLVQSAFKAVHHFSGAFFEHLQHLVYLTAYGTIRQWEDMWEEYIFIREELYKYDEFYCSHEGRKICNAICNYIIDLKGNNF